MFRTIHNCAEQSISLLIRLMLCGVALSAPVMADQWYGPQEYSKFSTTFIAGRDVDGEPIYLAMALDNNVDQEKRDILLEKNKGKATPESNLKNLGLDAEKSRSTSVDLFGIFKSKSTKPRTDPKNTSKYTQWFAGKLRETYNGMRYGNSGIEKYAKNYVVFNPTSHKAYKWVKAADGKIPEGSVKVWGDDKRYVCRAKWAKDTLIPGTLIERKKACYFAYGGRLKSVYVYEVLVKSKK